MQYKEQLTQVRFLNIHCNKSPQPMYLGKAIFGIWYATTIPGMTFLIVIPYLALLKVYTGLLLATEQFYLPMTIASQW